MVILSYGRKKIEDKERRQSHKHTMTLKQGRWMKNNISKDRISAITFSSVA